MSKQLPRRVLHVMNSAIGGAAFSVLDLIQQLRADYGIESCAVCHPAGGECDFERLRNAVHGELLMRRLYWWNRKIYAAPWRRPVIELRQQWATRRRTASVRDIVDAARRWGADLIHSNTSVTLEGGQAANHLGLPHVWHIRELIGPGQPTRFRIEGRDWGQYVARLASAVVCNSDSSAACIRDWLPANRLFTVYNGIDLSRFQPRTLYERDSRLIVGMIGNLTSIVKRHDWFVETAAQVHRDLPLEFRIYGALPTEKSSPEVRRYVNGIRSLIARNGLEQRVRFMGYANNPASEIDIMLHTTPKESFGRIVVEAMATAAPVIGVADGGVGEIVVHGKTGLLAEPGNTATLARHVEALATSSELRAQFGQAGLSRARERYSLHACARGVAKVYRVAMTRPVNAMASAC